MVPCDSLEREGCEGWAIWWVRNADATPKQAVDLLEQVPRRAMRTIRGLEHLSCEERLRAGAVRPGAERRLPHAFGRAGAAILPRAPRARLPRATRLTLGSGRGAESENRTEAASSRRRARMWVIPEVIGHAVVTVLMLISLHWFIFLLNLPIATWNIYRFIMVPSGNMGVFDPTEIHNQGQLKSHMKEAMIKLGFHLLCFFMYLYSMILALIND
ncbi:protein cornichon homolog 4 isoform X1 [Anser cygnoides]|uniref:protein cornichon homolog 4 isoform X1 n=1 Tax=Anser cygnoides TaxID=8845 RepID=UPI0034D182A1